MAELRLHGKEVQIFRSRRPAPLVVYHAVTGEGEELWRACRETGCPDFSLAVVNGVDWNDDMTPWPTPPISEGGAPFKGGADAYLKELTGEIMPRIVERLPVRPECSVLAGYSLAGLFAVYAVYRTDRFSRIVSGSGSLWYPDFVRFVLQNSISEGTEAVYLSLGDRECRAKNPHLASVEENTRVLADHFAEIGIRTALRMDKGGHFTDPVGRTARGIRWALEIRSAGRGDSLPLWSSSHPDVSGHPESNVSKHPYFYIMKQPNALFLLISIHVFT